MEHRRNWFFIVAGISSLLFGFYAGWEGKDVLLIVAACAAAALLFFGHLDLLESIKAGSTGVEAKLRKLDTAVDSAHAAVSDLRELAKVVGKTVLSFSHRVGTMGHYSDEEKEGLKDEIDRVFVALNIPEAERLAALWEHHGYALNAYVRCLLGGDTGYRYFPDELKGGWESLRASGKRCEPEQLRQFFAKAKKLTPEVDELIQDYGMYRKTGIHRRREVFFERFRWGDLYLKSE